MMGTASGAAHRAREVPPRDDQGEPSGAGTPLGVDRTAYGVADEALAAADAARRDGTPFRQGAAGASEPRKNKASRAPFWGALFGTPYASPATEGGSLPFTSVSPSRKGRAPVSETKPS